MNARQFNRIVVKERWIALLNYAWEESEGEIMTARRYFFRWAKEGGRDIWDMRVAQRKWKNFLKKKMKTVDV